MSDLSARTSSALAITEKKAHIQRPGGCVGIFFQLFDWNRRFAKKKFFPKKLLPPVRAKVSKKFNADEKLPVTKNLLIADESSGGFPSNLKKNGDLDPKKNEMRAPGLVARLMGLEAMPVPLVQHDKYSKGSPKEDFKVKGGRLGGGFHKEELSPEKGSVGHEVQPQKIQKTGFSDRRPVTRFGAEAFQIKNVLSRSRKHHHPKLASPVKSPKMGRNTSRLIEAAARILEPGIQATNRARCSLTYSNSMMQPRKEDVRSEVKEGVDLQTQPSSKLVVAQGACRACGSILEHVDARSVAEEQLRDFDVPPSNYREAFFCGLEESRSRPAVYLENENDVVLLKTRYQPVSVTGQPEENRAVQNEVIRNGMHQSQHHDQISVNSIFTSQKNASPSIALKHRTQRRGQMLLGDRVPPKSKSANMHNRRVSSAVNSVTETKDFIALNRNASRTRLRVPSKSSSSIEADRRLCTGKNDSVAGERSPVRKRRPSNASRQPENSGPAGSLLEKQRSNKGNVATGNGTRVCATSVNQTCPKSRSSSQRRNKNTDVVSFTFSSPIKSRTGTASHNEMGVKRRDPICSVIDDDMQQKLIMEENGMKTPSQNYLRMNGDALGTILEQKLKELTYQVENEAATGFMPSTRTTASILQELISALTAERPISYEGGADGPDTKDSECDSEVADSVPQAKLRSKKYSDRFSHEVDHFSPGCVLDASFSNECCISSSFDDSSVKPAFTDADLSDSASSTDKSCGHNFVVVSDLVKHTSTVLQNVNRVHARLTATKLAYVQDIILNTELLFGNAASLSSSRFVDFLLGPFLDELESLVIAAWKNSIILGIEVRKEESPLRRFLFDCLIDCLDVKYSRYSNSGLRAWSRLSKSMNAEVLIRVFDEEVRKWISFAGKSPDEIIESEMSTSLGKWTDFEIEAFETGVLIDEDIVHILVDEIVSDLCVSELSFC